MTTLTAEKQAEKQATNQAQNKGQGEQANQGGGSARAELNRQKWQQRAVDLRLAFDNLLARYEVYDPESISNQDAKQLYVDTAICSILATMAADDVRTEARRKKQSIPFADSLDRLGIGHMQNLVEQLRERIALGDDE